MAPETIRPQSHPHAMNKSPPRIALLIAGFRMAAWAPLVPFLGARNNRVPSLKLYLICHRCREAVPVRHLRVRPLVAPALTTILCPSRSQGGIDPVDLGTESGTSKATSRRDGSRLRSEGAQRRGTIAAGEVILSRPGGLREQPRLDLV
jgi:hypothetical protein